MNQSSHPNLIAAAWRKGEYFWSAVWTNNTSAPAWQSVTVASGATTNTGHLFIPQTPEQFSYDADGNLTQDGRWDFTWDAENRLVAMQSGAGVLPAAQYRLEFAYDYQGRRTQKIVYTNDGNAYVASYTNRFVYDLPAEASAQAGGWNLIARLDGAGNLLQSCVWGTDLSGSMQGAGGVGGLLAIIDYQSGTAGTYFPIYDGNGNITMLIRASDGTIAAQYEYGPFGELLRATGPMAREFNFLFSTKYFDWETGLYYYGYRYYDPITGRWLSRDPLGEKDGPCLYESCRNDCLDSIDRLGLSTLLWQKNECEGCNGASWERSNTCKSHPGGWYVSGASGSFNTSCSANLGTTCDTESHVWIRVGRGLFSCCRKWRVTCEYSYEGTVEGDGIAFIYVELGFIGRPAGFILEGSPIRGGKAQVAPWKTTLTAIINVDYWGWTRVASMRGGSLSGEDAYHTLNEKGSISCSAACAE